MSGQIFVPFKKRDRIEEMIPFLQALARPEMEIIFLTPYREQTSWMEVELTAIQTGLKTTTAITTFLARDSREKYFAALEEKIAEARETLGKKGLTISLYSYSGSLRNAIPSLRNSEDDMIVLMNERFRTIRKLTGRLAKFFPGFRSSQEAPIIFLRPRREY